MTEIPADGGIDEREAAAEEKVAAAAAGGKAAAVAGEKAAAAAAVAAEEKAAQVKPNEASAANVAAADTPSQAQTPTPTTPQPRPAPREAPVLRAPAPPAAAHHQETFFSVFLGSNPAGSVPRFSNVLFLEYFSLPS